MSLIKFRNCILVIVLASIAVFPSACSSSNECPDGGNAFQQLPDDPVSPQVPDFKIDHPAAPVMRPCMFGPQGCVELESWICPEGWVQKTHATLVDTTGAPFSWCEPPKLARLFVPGGNPDGTDYLTPIDEGEKAEDFSVCDTSKGLMPRIWGTGCVHIGDPCPTGDFPDIPAGTGKRTVYVKAGSIAGDGTKDKPFGTITEALDPAVLQDDDVVAIAGGIYDEILSPTKKVTLWGACVERVSIQSSTPGSTTVDAAINLEYSASLRNLRISGVRGGVSIKGKSAEIKLSGIFSDRTKAIGIYFAASTYAKSYLTVDNSLIFGTLTDNNGTFGRGIDIEGSKPTISNVSNTLIEANHEKGWFLKGTGIKSNVTDTIIRNTQPSMAGKGPCTGLDLWVGATMVAERIMLDQNCLAGLYTNNADQAQVNVDADYLAVRGTRAVPSTGENGYGIQIYNDSKIKIKHALISNNRLTGVEIRGAGPDLTMADSIVVDTLPVEGGTYIDQLGLGMLAQDISSVTLVRSVFESNRIAGVMVANTAQMTASDIVVLDTKTGKSGNNLNVGGTGIALFNADLKAERLFLKGNRKMTFGHYDGGKSELTETVVMNTLEDGTGVGGGLWVSKGASLTANSLLVDNFITYGIGATGGADAGNSEDTPITELVLADVIVRNYDMQRCFSAGDLSMGIGLMIYSKARANAERVQIENAGLAGVFVNGVGTEAALKDISVTGTHSIQCGAYIGQAGRGFDLSDGAHISLERALVQNNREVGMQVGPGTIVGMKNVEVADTLKRECADGEDTEQNACYSSDGNPIGVGIGLGVFGGGKVTGETVWLHGNRFQAGLRLSPYPGTPPEDWPKTGGTTEIRNMRIENNSYGAHLLKLPDGYDFFQSNPELFVENNLVSDVSTQESEDFSLQIIGIPGKIQ